RSRSASPPFPARSSGRRAAGSRRPTPRSSTSTRSSGAATSPPGRSRTSSRPRCEPPSARSADRHGHVRSHDRTEGGMTSNMQLPGLTRTDLQRHDLSAPGREMVQNRVDVTPEAPAIRHKHPGEEIIYVLEGTLKYDIDGQAPITVSAGEVLMVP